MTIQELRENDHSCTEPLRRGSEKWGRVVGVDRPSKSCLEDWGANAALGPPEEHPLRVGKMTGRRLSEGLRLIYEEYDEEDG